MYIRKKNMFIEDNFSHLLIVLKHILLCIDIHLMFIFTQHGIIIDQGSFLYHLHHHILLSIHHIFNDHIQC